MTSMPRVPSSENGAQPLPYNFVEFLPALYRGDDCEFLHRFLAGLQELWCPVEAFLEDVSVPYDTRRARVDFLPWLASWVGFPLNANWPERRRRRLIRGAVELYQWRGTRTGLEVYLQLFTGLRPRIAGPLRGATIGEAIFDDEASCIGDIPENCFIVTITVPEGEAVDESAVRAILDAEKPAHTAYRLRIQRQYSDATSART